MAPWYFQFLYWERAFYRMLDRGWIKLNPPSGFEYHRASQQQLSRAMNRSAFDIQPVNRFVGINASIRRPKVSKAIFYNGESDWLTIFRKSPASHTMTIVNSIWTSHRWLTTTHQIFLRIWILGLVRSRNWTIPQMNTSMLCWRLSWPWREKQGKSARRISLRGEGWWPRYVIALLPPVSLRRGNGWNCV